MMLATWNLAVVSAMTLAGLVELSAAVAPHR
jgi:hypothetical protein